MTMKQYTRKEVAECNASDGETRTLFIIDNKVYDVTNFLDEHPGGNEVLINATGKDASEDFADVSHSLDAKDLMQKYFVGELTPEERREPQRKQLNWEENEKDIDRAETGPFGPLDLWKVPVVIGVLFTLLYSYLFG